MARTFREAPVKLCLDMDEILDLGIGFPKSSNYVLLASLSFRFDAVITAYTATETVKSDGSNLK